MFSKIKSLIKNTLQNQIEIKIFLFLLILYFIVYKPIILDHLNYDDLFHQFYPRQTLLKEYLSSLRIPLWTERIFLGYPIFAESQSMYTNPLNLFFTGLADIFTAYTLLHITHFLGGIFGYYKLLKTYNMCNKEIVVGALIYFFSTYFIYQQNHPNIVLSFFILPLFLYLTKKWVTRPVFSLATTYLITLGHIQSIIIIISAAFLILLIENKKNIKYFISYVFLGVLIAGIQVIPNLFLSINSPRLEDAQTFKEGGQSIFSFLTLIYPFFYGNHEGNYWLNRIDLNAGIHFREYINNITLIGLLLGIGGFFVKTRKKYKYLYKYSVILIFLALFFAGSLNNIFLEKIGENIPVYNTFRYWIRLNFLLNLALSFLAAIFIGNIDKKFKPKIIYLILLTIPIALQIPFFESLSTNFRDVLWGAKHITHWDKALVINSSISVILFFYILIKRKFQTFTVFLVIILLSHQIIYQSNIIYKKEKSFDFNKSQALKELVENNIKESESYTNVYARRKDVPRNVGLLIDRKSYSGYSPLLLIGDKEDPGIDRAINISKYLISDNSLENVDLELIKKNDFYIYKVNNLTVDREYLKNKEKLKKEFYLFYKIGIMLSLVSTLFCSVYWLINRKNT